VNRRAFIIGVGAAILGGCAAVPKDPEARAGFREANDPFEPLNRKVFGFNQGLDSFLIKPVAKGYLRVVPRPARDSIRNFVSNLNEPEVFANNVLQGQFKRAGNTMGRFLLDTTVGIGGLFDVAGHYGHHRETGDFGQTLFVWGVPDGPYLVLPILGPSNPRDAAGLGVEAYINLYRYVVDDNQYPVLVAYGPAISGGIDERSRWIDQLDAIQKEAVDYYASIRSLFRQNRAAQLRGGEAPPAPEHGGFYDDPGAQTPPNAASGAGNVSH